MKFDDYLVYLYLDIPKYVYEGIVSIYCIGFVALFVIYGFKRSIRKILILTLVEYVFLIYCSAVFFRSVSTDRGFNLTPFWSYSAIQYETRDLLFQIIMNVVIPIPIGFMLGCIFRNLTWKKVLLIGSLFSLSIELLQFILKRGFSELDDVMHNTLGCMIGFILVKGGMFLVRGGNNNLNKN